MKIKRMVNAYGYVNFKHETFYIGEKLIGERINLCINPSCFGHMCTEPDGKTGIIYSESEQVVSREASKEIIMQEAALPTFCSQVLRAKSESLQVFKSEFRIHEPVSNQIGWGTSILLRNDYLDLTFNTFKRFKGMLSGFAFVNKFIHYFTQKFNSLIHKTKTINPQIKNKSIKRGK